MIMADQKIHCLKCRHYFSTFDATSPRGCKVYGFRSQMIPSMVVKRETGSDCIQYAPRPDKKPKKDKIDLNDPKNW